MSNIGNKIVARFRDVRTVRGYTCDFNSNRDVFHVAEAMNGKRFWRSPCLP